MAVPSYTTDLTTIAIGSITVDTGTWDESSDAGWDTAGAMVDDGNLYYNGTKCVSAQYTKDGSGSGTTGPGTIMYVHGSSFTITTDGAVLIHHLWAAPPALNTVSVGGIKILLGNGLGDFSAWDISGSDFAPAPKGGWTNYAINPAVGAADDVVGTGASSPYTTVGIAVAATAQARGNPNACNAVRYGRCESIFLYGETSNYCTFEGYGDTDATSTNKWSLIDPVEGGYKYQGLMSLGQTATAVDFRDSNVNINIANTTKVTSGFNAIEVNNASSNVEWANINITALGTISKGKFEMIDNATVDMDACIFTDMNTFIFQSNATVLDSTFRRCGLVTSGTGNFSGSNVLESTVAADTGAFNWNSATDPDTYTDGMSFSKGTNAHHAMDFGTSVTGNITLRNIAFSGFGSTDDSNDSTVRFLATSGSLTLSLIGCTVGGVSATGSNFSIDDAAGITVTLSIDPVTTLINVKDNDGANLQNARVYMAAADGVGDLPYEESVTSITRSGTTATVTHTAHGMNSNEFINISGITDKTADNYGAFQITVTGTNTYTYTTTDSGSTNYTGTIIATGVVLDGLTDVNGNISSSRTYGANQNVTGNIRKSSSSPRFKTFNLAGNTVSSSSGLTINVRLVLDE